MLKIHTANTDHADAISALIYEVQGVHAAALPHIFKPPSRDTLPPQKVAEMLAEPDNRIFVAYWDEEPAGYLFCRIERREESPGTYARNRVYIHHISVNRMHQGKGVGTGLIRAAADLAKEFGIGQLGLDVWAFNENAITFFQKQGFNVSRHIMSMDL